jgi:hypothetical protein
MGTAPLARLVFIDDAHRSWPFPQSLSNPAARLLLI